MKTHPVITLPDGRQVVVDAEMEIKEGDWGIPQCVNGLFNDQLIRFVKKSSAFSEGCIYVTNADNDEDILTTDKLFIGGKGRVIYSLGFSLPNVEEVEIISDNETENLSLGFGLFVYQCCELVYKREKEKRTDSEEAQRETVLKMFNKYKSDINYKASRNFTEEDLRKALNDGIEIGFRITNISQEREAWINENITKSLTRHELSEICIERYEVIEDCERCLRDNICPCGKIKSLLGKDSSGKEINIRIKK